MVVCSVERSSRDSDESGCLACSGNFPRHFFELPSKTVTGLLLDRELAHPCRRGLFVPLIRIKSALAALSSISPKIMMPQQKYQPLSAALAAPPLVHQTHHYPSYQQHIQASTSNGTRHLQREEEEEEDDEEEVGEDEVDNRDHGSPSTQSPSHTSGLANKSTA